MATIDLTNSHTGKAAGGHARAQALSPEERTEISSKAAKARWSGEGRSKKKKQESPFVKIAIEIGELVTAKNAAYGGSFETSGDVLRLLYPDGIKPEQYIDALALVRIWDKMKRIATDRDALGENPFFDIAGYSILGVWIHQQKKK